MKIFNLVIAGLVQTGLASECQNTNNGLGDTAGDGCDWYAANDGHCGDHDTDDFFSNAMCCSCGGGVTYDCEDIDNGFADTGGDKCSWYTEYDSSCHGYFDWENFNADEQCCQCGGGTDLCTEGPNALLGDSYGDSCAWYIGNESWCGSYDTADFKAGSQCCACQASAALSLVSYDLNCEDTNNGLGDIGGDKCDWYAENPSQCGWWDTWEFSAETMCCSCAGGEWAVGACNDDDTVDSWGDGCEWYTGNEWWCGDYDWEGFTASEACCACQTEYAMNLSQTYAAANTITGPIVADACNNNANGLGDLTGDGCDWYAANPG